MLRGPQTPGELKQRSERTHPFADLGGVQDTLERLLERELVVRHPRRPGQKEDRYEQVLGGVEDEGVEPGSAPSPSSTTASGETDRLDRLEREVAALRAELAGLREALGEDDGPSPPGRSP